MKNQDIEIVPKSLMHPEEVIKEPGDFEVPPMNYTCLHIPSGLTLDPQTFIGRFANKITSIFITSKK